MKEIKLEIRIHSLQYDELTPQDRELMDKAKEATSRSWLSHGNGGERGLPFRFMCRTHHTVLCQFPVSRPACADTGHRCPK